MTHFGMRGARALAAGTLLAVSMLAATGSALAQQSDRERAQMLQMQQQLQRLQSDNQAAQRERGELQAKQQAAEQAQKQTSQDLARTRQAAAAQGKELSDTKAQLADTGAKLAAALARIEGLQKDLAQRDEALQQAAAEKRKSDAEMQLASTRLKLNTARADQCEIRHDGLMKFSTALVDRYEGDRLRWCEPVTGIWKVHNEAQVQQLREQLYGYRLDVPQPKQAAVKPGEAGEAGTPQAR